MRNDISTARSILDLKDATIPGLEYAANILSASPYAADRELASVALHRAAKVRMIERWQATAQDYSLADATARPMPREGLLWYLEDHFPAVVFGTALGVTITLIVAGLA